MTFEEAGQQFANLQAQVRAGQLQAAQFQQMAAQIRVQDPSGNWWQIDPNSSQWMMWNGAQWTWPQQQARPAAPQPAYAQPAYAQPGYAQPAYPVQPPPIARSAPMPPQAAHDHDDRHRPPDVGNQRNEHRRQQRRNREAHQH